MNRIITLCMVLLLQMAAYAQGINGSDYNPQNPPGPHEDGYGDSWPTLTPTTLPDYSGGINITVDEDSCVNNRVQAGAMVRLNAFARVIGFRFKAWISNGDTLSTTTPYIFKMPDKDVSICAVFEFDPENPETPHGNKWDLESGELIMTDFRPGDLYHRIAEVTYRDPWSSYWDRIKNATVAGVCAEDFENYSWTTYSDWEAFTFGNAENIEFLDYSRTSGLTKVPAYCFGSYNTYPLKTIVMPASTASIGKEAFRSLKELTDITCFATTPPTFDGLVSGEEGYEEDWGNERWAFDGLTLDNIVVHVPAESVPLYQEARGWNKFMILPITQGVYRLTVSLPQAQSYKNMFLELANNQTGQSLRYVITDATSYTFNNLIRDTHHTLYVKNQRGVVMGTVEGIEIIDKDVQVSVANLKAPRDITLRLTVPDGSAVGDDAYTVTWTDRLANYLGAGATLAGQTEGSQVRCRVKLGETLGRQYLAPEDTVYTVTQNGVLAIALKAIPTKTFGGAVIAENGGQPLRGATVTVSQTLNGQFNTTQTVRTDADGRWTLTAFEAPTTITAQATEYIPRTDTLTVGASPADTIALRDLTGTVVSLDLYYYPTVAEGVEPSSENYTDYDNVGYTVYDETHGREVTEMVLQYPKLVLIDQQLDEGTQLRITANSLTDKFAPVTTTCKVDTANQTIATIGITEWGRLHAKFSMTDNEQVMGILYDAKGQLVGWSPYDNTELTVNNLTDGQYTLVTMGYNSLFTSVSSLTALAETGISDALLVKNTVNVQSGRITEITNTTIPTFKEDDFRLTGEGTAFTVNKSEVTVGQYVTLKAVVDFKASVGAAADVQLLFDLPEGCEYVQQSMMVGNHGATPQQEGRRLAVSMTDLTQAVRFCVVPTKSGISEPIAYVSFMNNGQRVTQPIGSVAVTAESLTITVPETTARRLLPVTGMAAPQSTVQVYDGDVLVAETMALGTGYWSAMAELNQPYNLSSHTIYAIVTNSEGMQMQSEVKTVTVNRGALTPVVTMHLKGTSSEHHKKDFVFDFRTGEVNPNGMKLTDFGEFTLDFNVDFYDQNDMMVNDTTAIRNVKLYVMMEHGEVFSFPLKYSQRYKDWYLATDYNAGNMPVNVDLDYTLAADVAADRQELDDMMEEAEDMIKESRKTILEIYRTFDSEYEPENKAELEELGRLLQIEEPDESTESRIDELVRVVVGDSLMDEAFKRTQFDFSEIDRVFKQENVNIEELERADRLLTELYENWKKKYDRTLDIDSLLNDVDNTFAELDYDNKMMRDSLLSMMSLICLMDTAEFQKPDGDIDVLIPLPNGTKHITIRKLNAVNVDELLAEGYVEMPMTDGKSIYCLQKPSLVCYVDMKTKTSYRMEILEPAEARRSDKEDEGVDVEVDPLTVGLQILPIDCMNTFLNKILGDMKDLGEHLGEAASGAGSAETFISLLKDITTVFLDGVETVGCMYDFGRGQFDKVVKALNAKRLMKARKDRDKALAKEKSLKKELATERANLRARQTVRNQYSEHISNLQAELAKAVTNKDKERLRGMINIRKEMIADIDQANKLSRKAIHTLPSKIAGASARLERARTAYKNVQKSIQDILKKINEKLPIKFDVFQKLQKQWFGWMSTPPVDAIVKAIPFGFSVVSCCMDFNKWIDLYSAVLAKMPCDGNETEAQQLLSDCEGKMKFHGGTNGVQVVADGGSWALSLTPSVPLVSLNWWAGKLLDLFSFVFSQWQPAASEKDRQAIQSRLDALKCGKDKDDEKKDKGMNGTLDNKKPDDKNSSNIKPNIKWQWPFNRLWYVRDPSGYVYEGVSSNRVEGVRASCYYKEQKEDMYGDLYDDIIFWDAENYEQENPLYTDADGRYAWDVPTGLWQVKYEKDGYETTYSDWLPVPPPQLEVNVGITQLRQPVVSRVEAYENAIEVEFDKYMNLETLNKTNISVTKGGKMLGGTVQMLNAEAGYQKPDVKYASRLAFVPTERLQFNEKVILTVRRQVESYAGLQMEGDYQQEFSVTNDTLPIERDTTQVDSTAMVVATPTASRISGTTVNRGATVTLSCATEGAIIWYTIDGTCPCDENGTRRRYVAPIVINDHLLLKAYAVKGVMQESEVVTFEYFVASDVAIEATVKTSAAGFATFYDSQNNYQMPSGLRAFCVEADKNQRGGIRNVYLEGSVIPKGTAVAIVADTKQQVSYTLTAVDEAVPYSGENLLHGSDVATTTTATGDCYFYKASYGPTGTALANWFGWYPANSAKGPFRSEAHRAWLAIPKSMATRSYYGFADDATAVRAVTNNTVANSPLYDLQGRRINNSQLKKGVYIRNRRKAIVK